MTRQALIRILLSLLLLVSQQMASTHVITHLANSVERSNGPLATDDLSSAFAQDQSCSQCLAFAQIAGALGSAAHGLQRVAPASLDIKARTAHCFAAPLTLAFHSRAPPTLS